MSLWYQPFVLFFIVQIGLLLRKSGHLARQTFGGPSRHLAGLSGSLHNVRRHEDQEFGLATHHFARAEELTNERNVAKNGNLVDVQGGVVPDSLAEVAKEGVDLSGRCGGGGDS